MRERTHTHTHTYINTQTHTHTHTHTRTHTHTCDEHIQLVHHGLALRLVAQDSALQLAACGATRLLLLLWVACAAVGRRSGSGVAAGSRERVTGLCRERIEYMA